jgi:hypothetical protein
MYDIRHIIDQDMDQVKLLYMTHTKLQRGKVIRHESDIDNFIKSGAILVGAFLNNELMAFMTYGFITKIPIYRLGNIYIKLGFKNMYYFNDETHPIPKILDFIIDIAESKGYYTWLYSRANLNVYTKLEKKNQDLLRFSKYGYDSEKHQYRYDKYIEEIVPPHGISPYEAYNNLFKLGQHEREIVIFKCCLKPEYRKWKLQN